MSATARGDIITLKTLIMQGADINEKDGSGNTAFIGRTEGMRILLDNGAVVNA